MPTVRQRLGLKRRRAMPLIPDGEGGQRPLRPSELRSMRLYRADVRGANAVKERNYLENAKRHVSLLRRHGRVRVDIDGERWEEAK